MESFTAPCTSSKCKLALLSKPYTYWNAMAAVKVSGVLTMSTVLRNAAVRMKFFVTE
jgi:hypothetical protein